MGKRYKVARSEKQGSSDGDVLWVPSCFRIRKPGSSENLTGFYACKEEKYTELHKGKGKDLTLKVVAKKYEPNEIKGDGYFTIIGDAYILECIDEGK